MVTSIVFYSVAALLLTLSFFKDKKKTKMALKKAYKSFTNLIPALIPMFLFVGIIMTIVSPEIISKVIGEESGIIGVGISLIFGSIIFMPSFVSFALGANLIEAGAGYAQVGALVAALMAVGISSLSVELKYFDKKLTIYRNVMAFIAAIVFAIIIGRVM